MEKKISKLVSSFLKNSLKHILNRLFKFQIYKQIYPIKNKMRWILQKNPPFVTLKT